MVLQYHCGLIRQTRFLYCGLTSNQGYEIVFHIERERESESVSKMCLEAGASYVARFTPE